jgi:hypothetical protein
LLGDLAVGGIEAIAFLRGIHNRWENALSSLTSAELDQVGRSQNPYGLDPQGWIDDLIA